MICLHTVKWFQVLLFNINNFFSITHLLVQVNGFEYCYAILTIQFDNRPFVDTQLNGSKYCNSIQIILFKISHFYAHSEIVSSIAM